MRHRSEAAEVHWIVATESWAPKWSEQVKVAITGEVDEVASVIAPGRVRRFRYPAAKLDTVPLFEVVDSFARAIDEIRPTIVYSVGPHDVNSDHAIVFRALTIALKPMAAPTVRRFLSYEVPSSTDWAIGPAAGSFTPNVFVDISLYFETKLTLVGTYHSQLREVPHPRSLEGIRTLNRMRGLSIGTEYAEAFELHRELVR